MGFSAVYNTDVGIKKKTNQDSLAIKIADTPNGQVVFSLVCDGMGGLAKGEVASKEVITAFCNWFDTQFVEMVDNNSFSEELLRYQWIRLAVEQNEKIKAYGEQNGFMLGTTISAILIYREMYYILHVGDSRVYEITSGIRQAHRRSDACCKGDRSGKTYTGAGGDGQQTKRASPVYRSFTCGGTGFRSWAGSSRSALHAVF